MPLTDPATFAARLAALRQQANLTRRELADAAGIPLRTLQDYEQGRSRASPSWRVVQALAEALGCRTDDLRG